MLFLWIRAISVRSSNLTFILALVRRIEPALMRNVPWLEERSRLWRSQTFFSFFPFFSLFNAFRSGCTIPHHHVRQLFFFVNTQSRFSFDTTFFLSISVVFSYTSPDFVFSTSPSAPRRTLIPTLFHLSSSSPLKGNALTLNRRWPTLSGSDVALCASKIDFLFFGLLSQVPSRLSSNNQIFTCSEAGQNKTKSTY